MLKLELEFVLDMISKSDFGQVLPCRTRLNHCEITLGIHNHRKLKGAQHFVSIIRDNGVVLHSSWMFSLDLVLLLLSLLAMCWPRNAHNDAHDSKSVSGRSKEQNWIVFSVFSHTSEFYSIFECWHCRLVPMQTAKHSIGALCAKKLLKIKY